jgi:hypothetical protein
MSNSKGTASPVDLDDLDAQLHVDLPQALDEMAADSSTTEHKAPSLYESTDDEVEVDARMTQLEKYTRHALSHSNPFEANLGALNGDLMQMAHALMQAIEKELSDSMGGLDGLKEMMPVMNMHLRYTKQVQIFSQLIHQRERASMPRRLGRDEPNPPPTPYEPTTGE